MGWTGVFRFVFETLVKLSKILITNGYGERAKKGPVVGQRSCDGGVFLFRGDARMPSGAAEGAVVKQRRILVAGKTAVFAKRG